MALCGVELVALCGADSWTVAPRYLFISVLGSLLFLIAVALIVSVTGSLDIAQAAGAINQNPDTHAAAVLARALLTTGMAMKVAPVSMQGWLSPDYAGAPGPSTRPRCC